MISSKHLSWSLILGAVGSALVFGGCGGGDDVDPEGGAGAPTAGTVGQAGSSPSAGSGGASAGSGGTSATGAVACPAPTSEVITDFTMTDKSDQVAFGDFTETFSGGTFIYPAGTEMYAVTSDVTENTWHISGDVGTYSGFGIYFADCTKLDASAYKGIQFTISGTVEGPEMSNSVTLNVGTAANEISHTWLNANKADPTAVDEAPNFGRCTPTSGQYDGTCTAPSKVIPVTTEPMTVQVLWADLVGGVPQTSVTPSEITFLTFAVPPPVGAGTASPTLYAVDITIDDLEFIP